MAIALQVNAKDNVATVFENGISAAQIVEVRDKAGNSRFVTVQNDIPYGHKFAIRSIQNGEIIVKYGEEIGIAVCDIQAGEHVHVHNLDSMRGRGDRKEEAEL